jgi:chemotaxis protein CheD
MEALSGGTSVIPATEVYLHPGELHVAAKGCVITTILGSCVSVCLYEDGGTVGGANHFLLAEQPAAEAQSTRYAPGAIDALVQRVLSLRARRQRLVAKLFGGANVLEAFQDGTRHIGAANVEAARARLARHNIPIRAEDVGGTRGRKITFSAHDGSAWVRVLRP